ncbi:MAG TPA: glutamine amidotransferase, partial [bacterium]|nr:glutamine amidotransferase [bacterium]
MRICHLYPDLLNLYGDRGNIMVLAQRARWRGFEVSVTDA